MHSKRGKISFKELPQHRWSLFQNQYELSLQPEEPLSAVEFANIWPSKKVNSHIQRSNYHIPYHWSIVLDTGKIKVQYCKRKIQNHKMVLWRTVIYGALRKRKYSTADQILEKRRRLYIFMSCLGKYFNIRSGPDSHKDSFQLEELLRMDVQERALATFQQAFFPFIN